MMEAILAVQWPISTEYAEDSRYNTLLQISIGQVRLRIIIKEVALIIKPKPSPWRLFRTQLQTLVSTKYNNSVIYYTRLRQ